MSTHKLGVIGDPIEHSLSPKLHKDFAHQFNIPIEYERINVLPKELDSFIKSFFSQQESLGLNVTLPHKEPVALICDELTPEASLIEAVNTLRFDHQNEKLIGHSTDGEGFLQDLTNQGVSLDKRNLLLLGSGGASRSIIPSILSQEPNLLHIKNRTKERSNNLISFFESDNLDTFNEKLEYDVLINATSVGNPISVDATKEIKMTDDAVFYDLNYGASHAAFNEWATNYSSNIFSGIGMLVCQAAASFKFWFGKDPNINQSINGLQERIL